MAITSARAKINGVWTNLTKNASTGKWEAQAAAPGQTSFNLSGGYYPIEIEATNDAGTKTTVNAQTSGIGTSCRLVVKETVKPVISLVYPTSGAHIANNKPVININITDEVGGSGVKISTLSLKVDSATYTNTSAGVVTTAITNGYNVKYTPQTNLSEGSHTITINVQDNDGNAASSVQISFVVDTAPPVLNVTSPTNNAVLAVAAVNVAGTTNDVNSSPVTVKIKLNNVDQGTVTVNANGSFSKAITLAEGSNTIVVTATDSAGVVATVTRTVTLDTTVPQITAVSLTPNPVTAGATVTISVTIS